MSEEVTSELATTEPTDGASPPASDDSSAAKRRRRRRPVPTSPAELAKRLRTGIAQHRASLVSVAARAEVPAPVVAAIKAARGWSDDTIVSAAELRQAAADWLEAPANEGGE